MDEFLGFFLKQVKGLGFAVSAFALLIGVALTREHDVREVLLTSTVWLAALFFHWLGGRCLDRWIYDPLFSTDGLFKGLVAPSRAAAQQKFKTFGWAIASVQNASRALFEHSEAWEKHVELWYELSKAARTLVLPLLALWMWEIAGGRLTEGLRDSWLGRPAAAGGLCAASLAIYLGLRVWHNRALYRLVEGAKAGPFAPGVVEIETLEGSRRETGVAYRFFCLQLIGSKPAVTVAAAAEPPAR